MALFSKLEIALGAYAGLDLLAPGMSRKIATKALMAGARVIAPGTVPIASALGPIAPIAIGAGLGAAALQTDPGQALLAAAAEQGRQDRIRFERAVQDTLALAPIRRKKRMSKFNRSVKKGMSIIKMSTSYGKKGVINIPKKAFSAVVKTVSKAQKGKAKPKSGVLKKVFAYAAKLTKPKRPLTQSYVKSLKERLRLRK